MSLRTLPHPDSITTANFEVYEGYPSPDDPSPDESPKVPVPLPGFHTYPVGEKLLEDSELAATVTTAANKQVFVAHPALNQVWVRDERIGRGGVGTIFREYLHSGAATPRSRVVKKQVDVDGKPASTPDEIKNELSLLLFFSQSSRPDLFTRCHGWFMEEDTHLVIAMELLSHDLEDHMEHLGRPIAEPDARPIVRQVLAALAFMHENNVSHRDVKLNNIMIATKPTAEAPETRWSVRLGDFGLSQYHADPKTPTKGEINTHGTPTYKAPELFHQFDPEHGEEPTLLRFEAKADIWALGITVYRMLTRVPPVEISPGDDDPAALRMYCKQGPPVRPLDWWGVSELGRAFIWRLTQPSQKNRPTAADALEHSVWVNGTVWE